MSEHAHGVVHDLDSLTYDPRVQRVEGLLDNHVLAIAENFKPPALGSVAISVREDGTQVILDGRHRVEAAKLVGWTGGIPADFYWGLSLEEEAEMFLKLNSFRSPSRIAKFLVRVTQGDPEAIAINDILKANEWRVAPGGFRGYFAAIAAIERVYRGLKPLTKGAHPDQVDRVIRTATAAWGHEVAAVHQTILIGLGALFARYGDQVNDVRLIAELAKRNPHELLRDARTLQGLQGGSVGAALARVAVGIYNKNLRAKALDDWTWTQA